MLENLDPRNWETLQWSIVSVASAVLAFVNRQSLLPLLSKLRGVLPGAKPSAGGGLEELESALAVVVAWFDRHGMDARDECRKLIELGASASIPPKGSA